MLYEVITTSADVELLKQDLAEMEVMLEGYLSFARGEGDENTEILNVKDIVKRIVVKSEREGFSVKLSDCDDVEINARPVITSYSIHYTKLYDPIISPCLVSPLFCG